MKDRSEAKRRGQSPNKKLTAHPYAMIEHRVLDSPAFADLKPASVRVLLIIARQVTKRDGRLNNGHLQATFSYVSRFGIGSEHTLQAAIQDLIAHGFIYRTRSHGANKVWARYALTWLPIDDKENLFLCGWKPCAWRDWQPTAKKSPRKICRSLPAESAVLPFDSLQKMQEVAPHKLQTMNLVPCSTPKAPLFRLAFKQSRRRLNHKNSPRPRSHFTRDLMAA